MIHYILILVYLNQNYPLCVIMHMRHDQTVWQSIWTIINCMLHNHCFFFIFVFTVILLRSIKNVHRPSRMDGYIHCNEATKMGHGRWGHQSCIVQSKVIPIQLIALYRTKAQRWFIENRKKKITSTTVEKHRALYIQHCRVFACLARKPCWVWLLKCNRPTVKSNSFRDFCGILFDGIA